MIFALVKNGVVFNMIVAEQSWVDANQSQLEYDSAHPFAEDDMSRPGVGWTFDGTNFARPAPLELG